MLRLPTAEHGEEGVKPRSTSLQNPPASHHHDSLLKESSSCPPPPPCFPEVLTSITDQPQEMVSVVNANHQENALRSQELKKPSKLETFPKQSVTWM